MIPWHRAFGVPARWAWEGKKGEIFVFLVFFCFVVCVKRKKEKKGSFLIIRMIINALGVISYDKEREETQTITCEYSSSFFWYVLRSCLYFSCFTPQIQFQIITIFYFHSSCFLSTLFFTQISCEFMKRTSLCFIRSKIRLFGFEYPIHGVDL